MRAPPFVSRARHYGVRAYEHARHGLAGLNRAVETGARIYGGVVQPLLKHSGVDTREADAALLNLYNGWDGARTIAEKIDSLL
jgi:hypothetical protein